MNPPIVAEEIRPSSQKTMRMTAIVSSIWIPPTHLVGVVCEKSWPTFHRAYETGHDDIRRRSAGVTLALGNLATQTCCGSIEPNRVRGVAAPPETTQFSR